MLTFTQALEKYRADQARDERGRFTSEGGGSRKAPKDSLTAALRSLGFAHRPSKFPSKQEIYRRSDGAVMGQFDVAEGWKFLRQQQRRAKKPKADWDALDRARSRALDRTSTPTTVEANTRDRGQQSPRTTPASFWSYKAPPTPGLDEAIASGAIAADTTWKEWESLSPGMRREIVRSGLKAKQDAELPDRMARYRRQTGLSTAAFIREASIELGLKPPKRALSSANKFLAYVRSQGLTSDTIENGFAGVTRRYA